MYVHDQIYALQEESTTGSDPHSFELLESIVKIYKFRPITLNFISTRMQLAEWSAEINECYRIERKSLSHTLVTRIKLN